LDSPFGDHRWDLYFVKWSVERRDRKQETVLHNKSNSGTVHLTIDEYESQLRRRTAEALEQYQSVEGTQKKLFEGQLSELASKLDNLEPAYRTALGRISELEKVMQPTDNLGGAKSLGGGLQALENANFELAQAQFMNTLAELKPQLKAASVAAYGLGLG
jgi:hypothetical protein